MVITFEMIHVACRTLAHCRRRFPGVSQPADRMAVIRAGEVQRNALPPILPDISAIPFTCCHASRPATTTKCCFACQPHTARSGTTTGDGRTAPAVPLTPVVSPHPLGGRCCLIRYLRDRGPLAYLLYSGCVARMFSACIPTKLDPGRRGRHIVIAELATGPAHRIPNSQRATTPPAAGTRGPQRVHLAAGEGGSPATGSPSGLVRYLVRAISTAIGGTE